MRRWAIWLICLLFASSALAQERERCDWCGCRGGPGYRILDSVAPQYQKRIGNCVSHRELERVCGTPPSTHCQYEGNRTSRGAEPPNARADASSRAPRPAAGERTVPALTE